MNRITRRPVSMVVLVAIAVCGHAFGLHRYIAPQRRHRARHYIAHHYASHHYVHHSRFRRILWNPVFRPSHDSLIRQNAEIDRLDLPRIQDDQELQELISTEELVPIVPSETLRIDPRLDADRRYCRPWTRDFLEDISADYYKEFHGQIQVNSAVRTVLVQKKLRRHNRNAAPETGETASSHLAGITVDIQRRGMSRAQIKWMEQYVLPLRDLGLVEPEEERHQWVFHVMVSERYTDFRDSKMLAGQKSSEDDDSLAGGISGPIPEE